MDVRALAGSIVITGIAGGTNLLVEGVTASTDGSSQKDIFTSMGVFGAALAIAYFMLKRGDKREKEMQVTSAVELAKLRVDIENERHNSQQATRQYVDALVEVGILKAEIQKLRNQE